MDLRSSFLMLWKPYRTCRKNHQAQAGKSPVRVSFAVLIFILLSQANAAPNPPAADTARTDQGNGQITGRLAFGTEGFMLREFCNGE